MDPSGMNEARPPMEGEALDVKKNVLKIVCKTLNRESVVCNLSEDETVLALKQNVHDQKGDAFPVAFMKLIYKGKILEDQETLKDIQMDGTKFVVIVVFQPKRDPPQPRDPANPSQPSLAHLGPGPRAAAEAMLGRLTDRGYARELASRALVVNGFNVDQAEAWLDSGAHELSLPRPNELDLEVSLSSLESLPQFQQVRRILRTNPQLLAVIMQQIQETNSDLFNLISENPEAFIELVNRPDDPPTSSSHAHPFIYGPPPPADLGLGFPPPLSLYGHPTQMNPGMLPTYMHVAHMPPHLSNTQHPLHGHQGIHPADRPRTRSTGAGPGPGPHASRNPGQNSADLGEYEITIGPEDQEALERLKALGFTEDEVIEAYMTCEKDETIAAHFLLAQHGFESDGPH